MKQSDWLFKTWGIVKLYSVRQSVTINSSGLIIVAIFTALGQWTYETRHRQHTPLNYGFFRSIVCRIF